MDRADKSRYEPEVVNSLPSTGAPSRTLALTPKLRGLPARKAKLALVETLRDLAVEDREFAQLVTPLLREFMGSRGSAEHAAVLVALARLRASHPDLSANGEL